MVCCAAAEACLCPYWVDPLPLTRRIHRHSSRCTRMARTWLPDRNVSTTEPVITGLVIATRPSHALSLSWCGFLICPFVVVILRLRPCLLVATLRCSPNAAMTRERPRKMVQPAADQTEVEVHLRSVARGRVDSHCIFAQSKDHEENV